MTREIARNIFTGGAILAGTGYYLFWMESRSYTGGHESPMYLIAGLMFVIGLIAVCIGLMRVLRD